MCKAHSGAHLTARWLCAARSHKGAKPPLVPVPCCAVLCCAGAMLGGLGCPGEGELELLHPPTGAQWRLNVKARKHKEAQINPSTLMGMVGREGAPAVHLGGANPDAHEQSACVRVCVVVMACVGGGQELGRSRAGQHGVGQSVGGSK